MMMKIILMMVVCISSLFVSLKNSQYTFIKDSIISSQDIYYYMSDELDNMNKLLLNTVNSTTKRKIKSSDTLYIMIGYKEETGNLYAKLWNNRDLDINYKYHFEENDRVEIVTSQSTFFKNRIVKDIEDWDILSIKKKSIQEEIHGGMIILASRIIQKKDINHIAFVEY